MQYVPIILGGVEANPEVNQVKDRDPSLEEEDTTTSGHRVMSSPSRESRTMTTKNGIRGRILGRKKVYGWEPNRIEVHWTGVRPMNDRRRMS